MGGLLDGLAHDELGGRWWWSTTRNFEDWKFAECCGRLLSGLHAAAFPLRAFHFHPSMSVTVTQPWLGSTSDQCPHASQTLALHLLCPQYSTACCRYYPRSASRLLNCSPGRHVLTPDSAISKAPSSSAQWNPQAISWPLWLETPTGMCLLASRTY